MSDDIDIENEIEDNIERDIRNKIENELDTSIDNDIDNNTDIEADNKINKDTKPKDKTIDKTTEKKDKRKKKQKQTEKVEETSTTITAKTKPTEPTEDILKLPGNNEKIVIKILETPIKVEAYNTDTNTTDTTNNTVGKNNIEEIYNIKCESDKKTYLLKLRTKNNILRKMMEELKLNGITKDASLKEDNLKLTTNKTFEIQGKLWKSAPKKLRINGDYPVVYGVKYLKQSTSTTTTNPDNPKNTEDKEE